jgi:hypothetical protein
MLSLTSAILAQSGSPRVETAEPDTGKPGAVLAINGDNLEKAGVTDVFLTDGKNDIKVAVTEQSAKVIKFKIPDAVKPGRYSIMLLTGGKEPKYLEQPVKVTVE